MMSCSRASSAIEAAAVRTLARWTSAVIGSPRFRSALPPSATTTRMSAAQRRDEERLDGVHPVLGLVKGDGGVGFEHLFGDLHAFDAELLVDLLADLGLAVVEGRQAVHELGVRVAGRRHDLGGDAVGGEKLDPVLPDGIRLA